MRRARWWAGDAAAIWAFLFAALTFYWAAGGTAGVSHLSRTIRESALAREPGFVAVLWVTGVLKVLAGLLALALARRWGRSLPRWALLVGGWGVGVLLSLYGGVGLANAALAELGVVDTTDPGITRWYLFLWEPIWLVGGILFVVAVRRYRRDKVEPGRSR